MTLAVRVDAATGAVGGQAFVSFPPPVIGGFEVNVSASFSRNGNWHGEGQLWVGDRSCPRLVMADANDD
jgi:hypothetical protein